MFDALQQYSSVVPFRTAEQPGRIITRVSRADQGEASQQTTQSISVFPGQQETGPDGQKKDSVELSKEAEEIHQLQARDREVRAHEAAHASVGGAYAGSPTYSFQRGADGQSYAVGGEVSIDVSPISGDPEATLQKAQQVQAAALAPAEPSAQDLKVAQRAAAMAAKARVEMFQQHAKELSSTKDKSPGTTLDNVAAADDGGVKRAGSYQNASASGASSSLGAISRLDIRA